MTVATSPRSAGPAPPAPNAATAAKLREAADLLAMQAADPFRVTAYRRAAESVAALDRPLAEIASWGGREALDHIPHVGRSIAGALMEMIETGGRWSYLDTLRGEVEPERLLRRVPGIGPRLAARLHEELGIHTLEELELAAHDGRLARLRAVGPRRAAAVRGAVSELLSRLGRRPRDDVVAATAVPDVVLILDVDREYREKARAGTLPTIAPRRFNPGGEAWLPVLHTDRPGGWRCTALYSNTARAHELGKVHDWVVVTFHGRDDASEGQCTFVTETKGDLKGMRVVRGREAECLGHAGEAIAREAVMSRKHRRRAPSGGDHAEGAART